MRTLKVQRSQVTKSHSCDLCSATLQSPCSFPLTPSNKNPSSLAETTTATSKKQSPLNRYQWGVSPRWFIILLKRHFRGRVVRQERKSPDRLDFNSTTRIWKEKKINLPQLLRSVIKGN